MHHTNSDEELAKSLHVEDYIMVDRNEFFKLQSQIQQLKLTLKYTFLEVQEILLNEKSSYLIKEQCQKILDDIDKVFPNN